MILDLLADGAINLTTIRILAGQLTSENHAAVLAEAAGRSKAEVLEIRARLAPRPDVPATVHRLPMAPIAPAVDRPLVPAVAVPPAAPAAARVPPLAGSPKPAVEPWHPSVTAYSSLSTGRPTTACAGCRT